MNKSKRIELDGETIFVKHFDCIEVLGLIESNKWPFELRLRGVGKIKYNEASEIWQFKSRFGLVTGKFGLGTVVEKIKELEE